MEDTGGQGIEERLDDHFEALKGLLEKGTKKVEFTCPHSDWNVVAKKATEYFKGYTVNLRLFKEYAKLTVKRLE